MAPFSGDTSAPISTVSSASWSVPPVLEFIEPDTLLWLPAEDFPALEARVVTSEPAMLQEFMGLKDGGAKRIFAYARKWGVLQLDGAGYPVPGRARDRTPNQPGERLRSRGGWPTEWIDALVKRGYRLAGPETAQWFERDDPDDPDNLSKRIMITLDNVYVEGTGSWPEWVKVAQAILRTAQRLSDGKPGLEDDWQIVSARFEWWDHDEIVETPSKDIDTDTWVRDVLAGRIPPDDAERPHWSFKPQPDGKQMPIEGRYLARAVHDWLDEAGVGLVPTWGAPRPRLEIGGLGLFAGLGMQIALAFVEAGSMELCSACGTVYHPKRKPRAGNRNFCPDCVDAKVPQKLAKRDQRRREAQERSTEHGEA